MRKHIKYIVQVCEEYGLKYTFKDQNHNFLEVNKKGQKLSFVNSATSLNSEAVARISKDKSFSYQILKNVINSPKTIDFLDPFSSPEFLKYAKTKNYEDTATEILKTFELPVILKPNSKTQGINVSKCDSYEEILAAVTKIFNPNSADYDYVLLAQEYLQIKSEYRVIVFQKEIAFVYLKDTSEATFQGNLSPLHWLNSKASLVDESTFLAQIQEFINPIFDEIDLVFGGLDMVLDQDGKLWLIEINTQPGFEKFLTTNDPTPVLEMYKKILIC